MAVSVHALSSPFSQILTSPDLGRLEPQKRYTSQHTVDAFNTGGKVHFVMDEQRRVFIAVTGDDYPNRVAHALLEVSLPARCIRAPITHQLLPILSFSAASPS